MSKQDSILIIEDDASICQVIEMHLQREGFLAVSTADGGDGLARALTGEFSLVILDLQLEGLGGIEVCKRIRKQNEELPIIILTSHSSEIDKVIGLEVGADDYVTKPFSPYELTARIRARLRVRTGAAEAKVESAPRDGKGYSFGELRIDPERRRVERGGAPVQLTAMEFDVLLYLVLNAGRPCTREMLLENVWKVDSFGYADSVAALIQRLRKKVEPEPANPIYILTVRGVGYRFVEPDELSSSSA